MIRQFMLDIPHMLTRRDEKNIYFRLGHRRNGGCLSSNVANSEVRHQINCDAFRLFLCSLYCTYSTVCLSWVLLDGCNAISAGYRSFDWIHSYWYCHSAMIHAKTERIFYRFSNMFFPALCTSSLGWPSVYYLHALVTCILFLMFLYFYREQPQTHAFVSAKELDRIKRDKGETDKREPLPLKV
ncbi:hypothetical protein OSTOST_22898, partial [Ostertagia ostertagi]